MNELNMRISAYMPANVRQNLEKDSLEIPYVQPCQTVIMFADVSGFTAMTESLAARGPVGAECLGKHLNSYFEQMLRLISSAGGDVFKFAGDAMIVFWSPTSSKKSNLDKVLLRCIQCALRIQQHLHEAELAPGVVLSVKMGIGVGDVNVIHLGGMHDGCTERFEYIAVGPALSQAFTAESQASAGDVIVSSAVISAVGSALETIHIPNSSCKKISSVTSPVKLVSRRPSFLRDDASLLYKIKKYVPRSVWPFVNAREESWGSELRYVTVMFINLGAKDDTLWTMMDQRSIESLHKAFGIVQQCVYDYEGTINKFLVDDKGSTVVAVFGLPPISHEDDPVRAILSSLKICAELQTSLSYKASIGITTGTAFCGVVGHQGNRREYTVLGDIVNLSARLMQRAKKENGGVITDRKTMEETEDVLHFETRAALNVKGKEAEVNVYRPYPRMSLLIKKNSDGRVVIHNTLSRMYDVQVARAHEFQNAALSASEISSESAALVLVRNQLVNKISGVSNKSFSGAFILEGEIGLGKTRMLQSVISKINDKKVYAEAVNPFANHFASNYSVWSTMLQNDDIALSNNVVKDRMTRGSYPCHAAFEKYLHLLNPILHTSFPKIEETEENTELILWFLGLLDLSNNYTEKSNNIIRKSMLYEEDSYDWGRVSSSSSQGELSNSLDMTGTLLLCYIYGLSREQSTVFVIDNAMYMDESSWVLSVLISQYVTNTLVVIATRPPSTGRSVHVSRSSFRKHYRNLKLLSGTDFVTLEPLSPFATEKLALETLGVSSLPTELCNLLVSRSQGNPLFLREIINEMLSTQVIIVNAISKTCVTRAQEAWKEKSSAHFCFQCHSQFEKGVKKCRCKCCGYIFCENCTPKACERRLDTSSSSDSSVVSNTTSSSEKVRHCVNCFSISRMRRPSLERSTTTSSISNVSSSIMQASPLKNRIALSPPPVVRRVLVALLDHLTVSQRMILKTASVIGPTFDVDLLKGAYPIEDHMNRIDSDLEELVTATMIRHVDVEGVVLLSKSLRKYEFSHGFMVDVIKSQMLSVQMDKLFTKVSNHRELREKARRQEYFKKSRNVSLKKVTTIPHLRLKSGAVLVKKQAGMFAAFRKKSSWKSRFAVLQTTRLLLQYDESATTNRYTALTLSPKTTVELYTPDISSSSSKFGFKLRVESWIRDKVNMLLAREFVFAVSSLTEAESWVYLIKYVVESLEDSSSVSEKKVLSPKNSNATSTDVVSPVLKTVVSPVLPAA